MLGTFNNLIITYFLIKVNILWIYFINFFNLLNRILFKEKDRTGYPVRSLNSRILQRKLLVDVLGAVERSLLKQRLDLAVRVDQRTDRHIVVQSGNEIRDVL